MGTQSSKIYSEDKIETETVGETTPAKRTSFDSFVTRLKPKWQRRRFVVGLNNEPGSLKMRVVEHTSTSMMYIQATRDAVLHFRNNNGTQDLALEKNIALGKLQNKQDKKAPNLESNEQLSFRKVFMHKLLGLISFFCLIFLPFFN